MSQNIYFFHLACYFDSKQHSASSEAAMFNFGTKDFHRITSTCVSLVPRRLVFCVQTTRKSSQVQINVCKWKIVELYLYSEKFQSLNLPITSQCYACRKFEWQSTGLVIQRTRVRFPAGRPRSCIFRNWSRFRSYNVYLYDTRISYT